MPQVSGLHWREACFLRRTPVVRHASCGLQRQASVRVSRGAGAPALTVSRDEVHHSSLLRARAVLRWLWSAHASRKSTALARGLFPSARARGATCKLLSPTPSQRRVCRAAQARLRSLSLGRRCRTHASCARAPCRAGCGRPTTQPRLPRRQEASLLGRTLVVLRASCELQRQANTACHTAQARLRTLCLGRRRSTQAW